MRPTWSYKSMCAPHSTQALQSDDELFDSGQTTMGTPGRVSTVDESTKQRSAPFPLAPPIARK